MKAWSPDHWTATEFPQITFLMATVVLPIASFQGAEVKHRPKTIINRIVAQWTVSMEGAAIRMASLKKSLLMGCIT